MSVKPHIPSHRKPRRSHTSTLLRAGVAGGVLSTLAVTTAASSASAVENSGAPADTVEMPALNALLDTATAQSAEATHAAATHFQIADARAKAAQRAQTLAAKKHAELVKQRKAEAAARQAAAERRAAEREAAAERAAQERADRSAERSAERSTLSTTSATESAQTGTVAGLLNFLRAQIGKSYVLGATGPHSYDCSGLTGAAFRTLGIDLPRTSQEQSTAGTQVSLDALQPGDILYWGNAGSAYHVAVYVGGGKFIGAQNSSTGVVERDLDWDPPTGAVRVL